MARTARKNRWLDIVLSILVLLVLIVLVLRLFVVARIEVNQLSMYPTLQDGQIVWGNKLDDPDRGDIVIFSYDDDVLIKRVVATEGDMVWVTKTDGQYTIYILTPDGQVLEEAYTWQGSEVVLSDMTDVGFLSEYTSQQDSYTVPEGYFLPMGDNRAISYDGRQFGVISVDDVIAVVINW